LIYPTVVWIVLDHYMLAAAAAAGATDTAGPALERFEGVGLSQAMYVIPVLNLTLTLCMFAAARSVPRDVEKVRNWMRDAATGPARPAAAK